MQFNAVVLRPVSVLTLLLCCRPGGIPARNSRGERLLLYLGIIDVLQSYRLRKRLEHAMKAMVHDGVSTRLTPAPRQTAAAS